MRPTSLDEPGALAEQFAPLPGPDAPQLMVDAHSLTAYGGTGELSDWAVARGLTARVPRLLLAGGLNPDNVAHAIAAVEPWGVDVSTGVEAAPGRKDHAKVARVYRCARALPVSAFDSRSAASWAILTGTDRRERSRRDGHFSRGKR